MAANGRRAVEATVVVDTLLDAGTGHRAVGIASE
jgi:hypothetical protein